MKRVNHHHRILDRALPELILSAALGLSVTAWASGQQENQGEATGTEAAAAAGETSEAQPSESTGQTAQLRAVVMEAKGRSQWRPGADAVWKEAAVNDVLDAGAMVRTGRKSSLALRVGQNASILISSNARLVLPEMVQEGQTLRTAVQLTRGRADFKVDRVGLTNDFSVVTPSMTLAVRGTGYGVRYGAFDGTTVIASRENDIRAIELRYFLSEFSYFMSGGATSSNQHNNPVEDELFKTFGPPPMLTEWIEHDDPLHLLDDAFIWPQTIDEWKLDWGMSGFDCLRDASVFETYTEPVEDVPEEPIEPDPGEGEQDPNGGEGEGEGEGRKR